MNRPIDPELMAALRKLRNDAFSAGEDTLGVLLAGVDLYLALGREFELIEAMKKFADEMKGPVDGTPTAEDLERLYRWDPPKPE
ncbi:MAG TPA: hypothetical protein VN428_04950 [Bryobacteraceae bacterium]|nr:hypothetical protein [Bryobacteraceae bacterium]